MFPYLQFTAPALVNKEALTHLYLSGCEIGTEGAKVLGKHSAMFSTVVYALANAYYVMLLTLSVDYTSPNLIF